MKIKVIKRFVDAETEDLHEVDAVLDKSKDRAEHLIKRGFAIANKEEKEERETKEEKPQYKTK